MKSNDVHIQNSFHSVTGKQYSLSMTVYQERAQINVKFHLTQNTTYKLGRLPILTSVLCTWTTKTAPRHSNMHICSSPSPLRSLGWWVH